MVSKQIAHLLVILAAAALATGCAAMKKPFSKEKDIAQNEMSQPARVTLDKVTAGGKVEKVTSETERGRHVYDVEGNVGGQHMEWLIAADTGEVLGTEVPIDYAQLPAPVRAAAEKHFGTSAGLKARKGVEYGETHYEIEGMKNGKMAEASYNPDGSPEK
jgi:hypothetical protein